MRLPPALFLVLTAAACESPPAFHVPGGPPLPVAVDAQFRDWTMGTWALRNFDEELGAQLAKYNMVIVPRRPAQHLVAEIDLGVAGNWQAIDVYVLRDGEREYAGRVRVPDLSPTTLDVSAQLLAPIIARRAWNAGGPAVGD